MNFVLSTTPLKAKICTGNFKRFLIKLGLQNACDSDKKYQINRTKYHVIVICNHDFDYFREVIDYDCDYIVFSMNVIDYDYEFAIVIVIVPTIAITDYDYPMPGLYTRLHAQT